MAAEPLTASVLAVELLTREVPLDVLLDAVGVLLDDRPDAAEIVGLWMSRMMAGGSTL